MRAQVSAWGLVLATSQAPTKCMPTNMSVWFHLGHWQRQTEGYCQEKTTADMAVEGGGFQMNLNLLILPNIFVTEYSYYTCVLGGMQM